MEDKIEVGEYVRTRGGHIHKVTKIDNNKLVYWGKISCGWSLEQLQDIIKSHSKNIIDLIEEGDYINGLLITAIYDEYKNDDNIKFETNYEGKYRCYIDEDIKSIVTKEQFKQIEYKVEE